MKRWWTRLLGSLTLGCGTQEQDPPLAECLPKSHTRPFRVLDNQEIEGRCCLLNTPDSTIEDHDAIIRK